MMCGPNDYKNSHLFVFWNGRGYHKLRVQQERSWLIAVHLPLICAESRKVLPGESLVAETRLPRPGTTVGTVAHEFVLHVPED